jgi:hypothetical protein
LDSGVGEPVSQVFCFVLFNFSQVQLTHPAQLGVVLIADDTFCTVANHQALA